MDYDYIGYLVQKSKDGDEKSKEKLVEQFRPFILNLSKRTFIDGYELYDIQSECYKNLFKCLSQYKLENHRFVAYATNGIKNNLSDLIKRCKTRSSTEGNDALPFSQDLEENLIDNDNLEEELCNKCDVEELRHAINNLTEDEKELVQFIFFENNTIRKYAYLKKLCYSTAHMRKRSVLKKIYKYINDTKVIQYS